MRDAGLFRILIVCTANRCRSPMAEHMLRAACARAELPWEVCSAGTQALDGGPMEPFAARALEERSVSVAAWSTTRLTASAIDNADLVLTAESEHRAAVAALRSTAAARSFTLLQFARLARAATSSLAGVPGKDSGEMLMARIGTARAMVQPASRGANELADPIGMSMAHFRGCAEIIDHAISQVIRAAVGPPVRDQR